MTGLFDHLPRSRPPRRLMKVEEVYGMGERVLMACKRHHKLEVDCVPDDDHKRRASQYTAAQLRKGIPCEICSEVQLKAR